MGSEQAVIALLSDPAFYLELVLPDLSQPSVLEQHDDADQVVSAAPL